jgi:glutamyl-tRNA reductase
MLIGAGETAELILQHLLQSDASEIIIVNRTFENALRLAKQFQGSAIQYENRYHHLETVDIVISSTGSQDLVIKQPFCDILSKRKSAIFFIDVAIPRDIDPEIAKLANCYLYHLDDLQKVIASNYNLRKKELVEAEHILSEEWENFLGLLNWRKQSYLIKAFQEKQKQILDSELEKFFTKHSHLKKEQDDIQKLVYQMNQKTLHHPYLFLKKECSSEVKKIFSDVFGLQLVKNEKLAITNNKFQLQQKNEQKI